MPNILKIKEEKENIIIRIEENIEHDKIIETLKKKITEIKKLAKENKSDILVIGKDLKAIEQEEIKRLIESKTESKVRFDIPRKLGLHGIKKSFDKEIQTSETKFHRGSLRSGQRIEFEGSIVVLGDVNGGAEVIASDNIVVLGVLRGLAHAGAKGNKKAIIAAASIECTQLRISNIIKEIEKEEQESIDEIKTYAYVEEEKIIVE